MTDNLEIQNKEECIKLEGQDTGEYRKQQSPNLVFNEAYRTEDTSILLEHYKLYVDMHDRVVERRGRTNNFYISLLSGSFAFVSILSNERILTLNNRNIDPLIIVLLVSCLGFSLSFLWLSHIRAYAVLIRRKVKVIREMEDYLPFYAYCREEVLWKQEVNEKFTKSIRISTTEQVVAVVFGVVFLAVIIYSIVNLLI